MAEELWREVYLTGDREAPAYWFWLNLRDIPLLRNALQAITHITEVRLAEPFGNGPASDYMVQAVISPDAPDDVTEGDRARFETLALRFSESGDVGAAVVWASAAEGFRRGIRRSAEEESP